MAPSSQATARAERGSQVPVVCVPWLLQPAVLNAHAAHALLELAELVVFLPFLGLVMVLLLRAVATRWLLRSRSSRVVVPASDFDPQPEEITRVALQLARTQRTIGGSMDRRGSAVRIRLDSFGLGETSYSVEAPRRSMAVLEAAGFEQTTMVRPEDLEGLPGLKRAMAREHEAARRRDGALDDTDEEATA